MAASDDTTLTRFLSDAGVGSLTSVSRLDGEVVSDLLSKCEHSTCECILQVMTLGVISSGSV